MASQRMILRWFQNISSELPRWTRPIKLFQHRSLAMNRSLKNLQGLTNLTGFDGVKCKWV